MIENCKNCNENITGSFCSNCGQRKYKRIDRKYIMNEFQSVALDLNKGFLYSVKNILKNPGKTANEFIEGNRVNHYKPILLAFVLTGFSTFLSIKVINLNESMGALMSQNPTYSDRMSEFLSFTSNYNSLIMLLLIPIIALTTKLAFRKWGHNYYEHIIMNAFGLSFHTLISIILVYPVMFIFRNSPNIITNIVMYTLFLIPFIMAWFFKGFYKDKSWKSIILKVIGIIGYLILGYLILGIIVGIIAIFLSM